MVQFHPPILLSELLCALLLPFGVTGGLAITSAGVLYVRTRRGNVEERCVCM